MNDDTTTTPPIADADLDRIKADLIAQASDEPLTIFRGPACFPYVRRVDGEHYGLVSAVAHETEKAWLVERPSVEELWLPKSQCQYLGEDDCGRAILIVPAWILERISAARFLPAVSEADEKATLARAIQSR